MTQGVKMLDPASPASPPSLEGPTPVAIVANGVSYRALQPILHAQGFEPVRRDPEELVTTLEAQPEGLLLVEARAAGDQLGPLFSELAQRAPGVRRMLLAEGEDCAQLAGLINEGLIHRLLLRPLPPEKIAEAIEAEARHLNMVMRTSELKALAARKSHELDLAQRLLRLQRLAAVGTLAAGLAHEINNPLGSILAFAQILMREGKFQGEDLEALQFIEHGAVRCKRVIDAVVRFAHMANAPEADTPVSLREVAEETVSLMAKELEAAGVALALEVAAPQSSVRGSFQSLVQLLQALLANAGEATHGGTQPGKVTARVFPRDEQRVCLSVTDNGRGIAAELRDRIFEPFYTTKTEGEAIGLGLTTADRIAHMHGGVIEVESELGAGSTFTVVLPRLELGTDEGRTHV